MVDFITAVKSVSAKGRRRKLKGRPKEEVVRQVLMKAVNTDMRMPIQKSKPPLNPLNFDVMVSDVAEFSPKIRAQEMKSELDFCGEWAPWSKVAKLLKK